jgi:hypothetical protein
MFKVLIVVKSVLVNTILVVDNIFMCNPMLIMIYSRRYTSAEDITEFRNCFYPYATHDQRRSLTFNIRKNKLMTSNI